MTLVLEKENSGYHGRRGLVAVARLEGRRFRFGEPSDIVAFRSAKVAQLSRMFDPHGHDCIVVGDSPPEVSLREQSFDRALFCLEYQSNKVLVGRAVLRPKDSTPSQNTISRR